MLTTAPTHDLEVWGEARRLRVALIAPPTAAVPPSSLGGLDHVRRLAEGLAERGHQVVLIGVGLGEFGGGVGYTVVDTDPIGGPRAGAEILERLHAEQAGKVLEQLGDIDLVSDHTRTGWRAPAGRHPKPPTVQTCYWPVVECWELVARAAEQVAWVAVSQHQQHNAPGLPWAGMIPPGIPVGKHPLSPDHDGPCVYLGPLLEDHGAGLALEAAHRAGRPIVLAGTRPSPRATAYTVVELRPQLAASDELLDAVSPQERWELLASASCLVAPLHPQAAFSLEVVEAMAYGTPVVTTVGTVGAELVSHCVSGLVISDAVLLPEAISRTERLDPGLVRAHAASRFDLGGMVSAYESLFTRLVGAAVARRPSPSSQPRVPTGDAAWRSAEAKYRKEKW
jgi:hypothetical protein